MLNISDLKLKKISELQEIANKIGLKKLSQKMFFNVKVQRTI